MLEQLGLGIVLSFQDNFTPQANNAITSMFKLETQAEQMASNVQKSLNNLQNLMLSGFSLSQIGGEFDKAGKAITNFFGNAFKEIAKASAQMETYKAQFKTVFGAEANKKMDWAVDFAVKTPFELTDLVSSMQKMGSQKIDVSKTFKNSLGQDKAFMEYMGDLATRNMDATGGIQGMGIAISNAWSGQLRSLEQRFDLAKQDLAGLKKYAGKDQAKFMEEFVKLADKYAPNAMKNLEGTWEQTLSNMDDAWFNMMFRLGDKDGGNDVFGSMKKSLNKVAELLFEVSSSDKMLGTLRSVFDDLWKPVDKLADVLVKAVHGVFAFAEAHPTLTKFLAKLTAIAGISLVAVGTFMKLAGGVMIFTTSLISAYANLKILKSLNLGGELASITRGFGLLGSLMSTSVITAGALGLAYKFNIGGARKDVDNLIKSFKEANNYKDRILNANYMNLASITDEQDDSLGKRIGYAMARLKIMKMIIQDSYNIAFKGQSDVLSLFTQQHFEPIYTLGLASFRRNTLIAMHGLKDFITSFKMGLGEAYNTTKEFIGIIIKPFVALKDVIAGAFGVTSREGAENFREILKDIGAIAGSVLGALVGFKVVKGITNILLSPFKALLGILGKVGKKARETFSKLNPMNWYNKTSKKQYESILNTRGQVSRMTGRGYSEAEFKKMGLGLTRSQRRAGFISQKRAIEQSTGRHFTTKQLSAMGIEKPVSIFKATAKSFRDSAILIKEAIKSKSSLVDTRLSRDPNSNHRLANLNPANQLDRELKDVYFAGRKGYDKDSSIEVKSRPKWINTLFGQKFSAVDRLGNRTNLGSYGGAFTRRKDDNQMRLASQLVKPRGLDRSEFSSEKEYRKYMKSKVAPDETTGFKLKNLYRNNLYEQVSKRLGDYIGTGKEGAGQFRKNYTMSPQQIAEIDAKRRQAVMGVLNNDESVLSQYSGRNTKKINNLQEKLNSPTIQGADANAEVFAKKQGYLSKALFGQKYYTVGQKENGDLYEQQVTRKGGLFNKQSNDMKIKVDPSQGLGTTLQKDVLAMKNSAIKGLGIMGTKIKGLGSTLFSKLADTSMFSQLSNAFSTFKTGLKAVFKPSTYKLSNLKSIINTISTQVPQLVDSFTNNLRSIFNKVKSIKILPSNPFARFKQGMGNMKDNLVMITKSIGTDLGKLGSYLGNLVKGTSIHKKFASTKVGSNLIKSLNSLGRGVNNTVSSLYKNTLGIGSKIKGKITSPKKLSFRNTTSNVGEGLGGAVSNIHQKLPTFGISSKISEALSSLGSSISSTLSSTYTSILNISSSVKGKFVNSSMYTKLVEGLSTLESSLTNKLSSIYNSVLNTSSSIKGKFLSSSIFTGLAGAFSSLTSTARSFIARIQASVTSATESIGGGGLLSNIKIKAGKIGSGIANQYNKRMPSALRPTNIVSKAKTGVGKLGSEITNQYNKKMPRVLRPTNILDKTKAGAGRVTTGLSKLGSSIATQYDNKMPKVLRPTSIAKKAKTGVVNTSKNLTSKLFEMPPESLTATGVLGGAVKGAVKGTGKLGSGISNQYNKRMPQHLRPMTFAKNTKNYMSDVATSFKRDTRVGRGYVAMKDKVKGSNTGKYFSQKFSGAKQGFKGFSSNAKTGLSKRLPSFMPSIAKSQGGIARLGKGTLKGFGTVGRGAMGLGKGAISGAKLAGKGVGAVGRGAMGLGSGAIGLMGGAMRMVPQLAVAGMVGSAVVGGVKNRGANLNKEDRARLSKKRGLKKDDNLGLGMAKISDDLSKFDFKKFWAGFKKSSKQMLPIFKDIFKDIVRIGKESFPIIFKEAKAISANIMKELPSLIKQVPSAIGSMFEAVKPIAGEVWTSFKEKMSSFIADGLPRLSEGFKSVCDWVASNGIPLIVQGFGQLLDFVGSTVVPGLLEGIGQFVDWVISDGIPTILTGLGELLNSIISNLPQILSSLVGLLGDILVAVGQLGLDIIGKIPGWVANLGTLIMDGIKEALSNLGSLLSGLFKKALSGAIGLLPDVLQTPLRNVLNIHHGGLYLSPDEHPAIVQEGETILPKGKAERLDAMLEGRAYWQNNERAKLRPQRLMVQKPNDNKEKSKPTVQDMSSHVRIENVEVKLVADKLSRADARKQALMLMDEFRKIQKENDLKNSTRNKRPLMV